VLLVVAGGRVMYCMLVYTGMDEREERATTTKGQAKDAQTKQSPSDPELKRGDPVSAGFRYNQLPSGDSSPDPASIKPL
jgi:hypothetical protein